VAVAALLVLAAPAGAAARLSAARVVSIAASQPGVAPLLRANAGADWETTFERPRGRWIAVLHPKGGQSVLAAVTIADATGAVVHSDVTPLRAPPRLTAREAAIVAGRAPALRSWLRLYARPTHSTSLGKDRVWTVSYFDQGDQEIAEVHVSDDLEQVTEVRTGPQVQWMLARGLDESYGRKVNRPWLLWPLCALFLAGTVNWRRPLSLRTLDMLALVSFTASLWWFDRGDVFRSTPLIYPPLVYLLGRMVWLGCSRRPRQVEVGPRHMLVLVALLFALVGFRLGLNNQDSNVIDVGYASVAGAGRLIDGVLPYGHMPVAQGKPCAGRYSNGDPIGYVQKLDGRCESPVGSGDTYGPTVYAAYVPFVAALGWSGLWDDLPAAHAAAAAWDLLATAGIFVAGWRLAGPRIGLIGAFAWNADPFTLYSLNMNSNDALVGALVAWTIALLSWPAVRGALLAAAALTKFAPLALLPLFASLRNRFVTLTAFAAMALVLLSMLALDADGLRLFWDRTLAYQLGRRTPMSIWTLGTYHPGWPDLRGAQRIVEGVVAAGVLLLLFLPRRPKDAGQVAALGAACLIATQLVARYWFYPYITWWLPLVLLAFFLPRIDPERVTAHA
jgi:Glycosyltransferase family 87